MANRPIKRLNNISIKVLPDGEAPAAGDRLAGRAAGYGQPGANEMAVHGNPWHIATTGPVINCQAAVGT